MKILPSDNSYRTFCELAGSYRLFWIISEAVDSGVIDLLVQEARSSSELLAALALEPEAGQRFIALLVNVGLLEEYHSKLFLSRFSRTYLCRQSASSQRHVMQFEPLLMENWNRLGEVLHEGQGSLLREQPPEHYRERLELFQMAMGEAAAVRSQELWDAINLLPAEGTIIDIGAGDGAYLREFMARRPNWRGIACDLADVCARSAASTMSDNLTIYPCNIIDPQELAGLVATYHGKADLLLLSNICHCYGPDENRTLLLQAAPLLAPDGLLVVHDFFRDANSYGAIYDLHMLVNTFNGRCYSVAEITELLQNAGFRHQTVIELPSDSLALVASRTTPFASALSPLAALKSYALSSGFFAAVEVDPVTIRSEAWVRAKCSYGCAEYGKRWSCPPHSMDPAGFTELLGCYSRALLVAGQPPLRVFQEQLLALEKEAFLAGFAKALVFSGGPCCWCEACPPEGCRHPEKRRPSLESCGCDVFSLARSCGLPLVPLKNSDDFVQYIGLLLVA